MADLFDGGPAGVRASLNRVRILQPPPGLDEDLTGLSGYELLGAEALAAMARTGGLPPSPDPIRSLNRHLRDGDPPLKAAATTVARRYGRRLGALLWVVLRGDAANRPGRPQWADEHWAFWAGIRRVLLGGGLLAGPLGAPVVDAAQAWCSDGGIDDLALRLAPWPAEMVLVGLGLLAPDGLLRMPLIDCGQTWIKRAVGWYGGGALVKLERLPPLPAHCGDGDATVAEIAEHFGYLADVVAETVAEGGTPRPAPAVAAVALATHLARGHVRPDEARTCYGRLQQVARHLESDLAAAVAARLGRPITLILYNDAAAAALLAAGLAHTVVLTLGTAIGTGVPPSGLRLRALAPGLRVVG